MRLRECREGVTAEVLRLEGEKALRRRLMEMGFLPGRRLKVIRNAPLRDPMEIEIMGYLLAIRKEEAGYVLVRKLEEGGEPWKK